MKLFNMDLHISVIADFKKLFPDFDITHWCLSGHSWVFNSNQVYPKYINPSTWKTIDTSMIEKFQNEYDTFLQSFDAFICGYPGVFAMLFEKYNKPIIFINATRYDMPFCWNPNETIKREYTNCLKRLEEKKLLLPVSNNLADVLYMKRDCDIDTIHIPSLCLYTGITYAPTKNTFLCYHGSIHHPLVENLKRPFSWSDIGTYKGVIHIPYEISTMSMFEHFSAGIPLFFPSKDFMMKHVSIQSSSAYGNRNVLTKEEWLEHADFYNVFKSPNVYIFDSYEHLYSLLTNFQWKDDREVLDTYRRNIKESWEKLAPRIFLSS